MYQLKHYPVYYLKLLFLKHTGGDFLQNIVTGT